MSAATPLPQRFGCVQVRSGQVRSAAVQSSGSCRGCQRPGEPNVREAVPDTAGSIVGVDHGASIRSFQPCAYLTRPRNSLDNLVPRQYLEGQVQGSPDSPLLAGPSLVVRSNIGNSSIAGGTPYWAGQPPGGTIEAWDRPRHFVHRTAPRPPDRPAEESR